MENKKAERQKRIYRRLLLGFFCCMLFFTVMSRIVDSYRVAKVETSLPEKRIVVKTVKGTGTVEAGELTGIQVTEGLLAGKVEAGPGAKVKEGEPLFYYDSLSMADKQKMLLTEISSLELKLEQERLGAERYDGVSDTELARQSLAAAEKNLARQREKTRKAAAEHDAELTRLREYYDKRLELSDEELISQSREDYNRSQNEYDTAQLDQEAEIRRIKRKLEDTRRKLERLEAKEDADQSEIEELYDLLDEYEEELDLAEEKWDLTIIQAEDDMDRKEEIYNRSQREITSARLALQETYENAVSAADKSLETALEEEQGAADAVNAAALAVDNAKKNDHAQKLTAEQAVQLAELRCRETELALTEQRELLWELEELIAAGGMVAAPCDGTVTLAEVEQGKKLTGEERFFLSSGDLVFEGSFDRDEDGNVSEGDEVNVHFDGEQRSVALTASQVDLVTSGETGTFLAKVPEGGASLGSRGSFECIKRTDVYNIVIPLNSLRKDMSGYFCLVLQNRNTILGEEYRAARVDVELLFSGDTVAAVQGTFTSEDRIISGSDRVVNVGDRVRPLSSAGGN
ncbi:hypothetical protein [Clostridium sp. AN503]|uniref:hypothetical protein n=1 Tax=Clostridium sp. AN503 TaxID=3160598 RepID=UPI003457A3E0